MHCDPVQEGGGPNVAGRVSRSTSLVRNERNHSDLGPDSALVNHERTTGITIAGSLFVVLTADRANRR